MAHIHKQLELQNGDIIDAEDFNADIRELAGEFNGMLDRDNFKDFTFNFRDIAPNTFTKIYSHQKLKAQNDELKIENKTTSMQTGLMVFTFETNHDGMLICEWSGSIHFKNPPSASNSGSTTCQYATLQMTVNGNIVAEINKTTGGSFKHPVYMVGAIPISPGRIVVSINGRTADIGHTTRKINIASSEVLVPYNEVVLIHRKR